MKLTEARLKEFVMNGLPLDVETKQQILENQNIIERLTEFTESFGHLPCNEFPNWRWWQKLKEDVWGDKN